MNTASVACLLQKAIGLDIASVGQGVIRSAIQQRIKATGSENESDYFIILQSSPAEMAALVEEVVVPETWFFRHEEAFRLMGQYLCGEWKNIYPDRIANILSIPCSTGEEAYSIAMTLMDHGLTPERFHIDAIDVSSNALARARQATYGNNSFRGGRQAYRQQYFEHTEKGYALKPEVRQSVHFYQGNILNHDFMKTLPGYDVIFCRNLLIYLDPNSRKQIVELLARMLNKEGLLFVGHAETGLLWKDMFDAVPHPMTFAYRHRSKPASRAQRAAPPRRKELSKARAPYKRDNQRKPGWQINRPVKTDEPVKPIHSSGPSLDSVSRLADRGHLEEARRQCEAYLQIHDASAQAYFLLGLISDIQSNKEKAREFFRKALYLEPDHYEALIHLALLLDQTGDHNAARRLRARVQQLSENLRARAES